MYTIISHNLVDVNIDTNDLYEYFDTYEEANKVYSERLMLLKAEDSETSEQIFVNDPETMDEGKWIGGVIKIAQTGPGHLISLALVKGDIKSVEEAKKECKKLKKIAVGIGLAAVSALGGYFGYKIGRERGMNYMAYWTNQLRLQGYLQYIRPDTKEVVNGIEDLVNAGMLRVVDKKGRIVQ